MVVTVDRAIIVMSLTPLSFKNIYKDIKKHGSKKSIVEGKDAESWIE